MALDTMSMEQLPIASLVKPMTQQLLDSHFASNEDDLDMLTEMKNIATEEFESR